MNLSLRVLLLGLAWAAIDLPAIGQTMDARLKAEPAETLAADARANGDARRGAIVFYQPFMSCRKCHDADDPTSQLGPDLTKFDKPPTDRQLVEAVLHPSKEIREGYESVSVLTDDGRAIVGIVADNGDPLVLRDPTNPALQHRLPRDEIEAIAKNANSLMPSSLANQLSSRQQFLDLLKYLMTIRDEGPRVARNLEPAPHLYAARPLPEYEKTIDHAGMISDLGRENTVRGKAIYDRLCVNCHGTQEQAGSLPTSLRFAEGTFKNGSDPYTMYQTLTRGFGMMQPQSWMVPQQKYDVIHYIRQSYLKPHNPSEYFDVTSSWLASLPKGDSRGPDPTQSESWVTMDYGDALINTYEVGDDAANFAYKGIAVRLDPGPGGVSRGDHWMIFDHDTMRMAATWSGDQFIDWKGIHFNGQHNAHPRVAGTVHVQNETGPGWAHPMDGTWEDPRQLGRDDRRYGPLPKDWAHYQGMHRYGGRTVIDYRVGDTPVRESPQLIRDSDPEDGGDAVYGRRIEIGARPHELTLQVASLPENSRRTDLAGGVIRFGPSSSDVEEGEERAFEFDGSTFAEVDAGDSFDMTSKSFSITSRIRTEKGGSLFAKTASEPEWVEDGKVLFVRGGRLVYDIGWVGAVRSRRRVDDGKWHDIALTWDHKTGEVTIFVDGKRDSRGSLRPKQKRPGQVVRLGYCATDFPLPDSHFRGEIEHLRFYDRRLKREELPVNVSPAPIADWTFARESMATVRNEVQDQHHARVSRGVPTRQAGGTYLLAGIAGRVDGATWVNTDDDLRLRIPAGDHPLSFTLWFGGAGSSEAADEMTAAANTSPIDTTPLRRFTEGGPARHPEVLQTQAEVGDETGPFAVDVLTRPTPNPWLARVRLTGFDFYADGDSAAVCSWDGDVWHVRGIDSLDQPLRWRRIATGLFQPLGVRIVDETVHVTCRDQIVILRDKNGDGETDFFENFNNDHQVTDHFHEFAMGLQTDEAGNFYYAKSARHALPALVPHHGTLLRVSADGAHTEIVANGFRAANGVCLNPDGTFIVTDQEGHWNPKNRINWVREGGFYGNMFGYHDVDDSSDSAMEPPLCWITNAFDRSPAELLWVPPGCWGPLSGSLLNLSYGYGKVFVVPHETVGGQVQGGMCELPLPQFPTGLVRGRFHPTNGHLYTCGMFAWAGNQQQPGGFYRIRHTGKPMHLPVELHASPRKVTLRWTDDVSRNSAVDPQNYSVTAWDLKRTANYGSKHYNEREWPVERAELSADGKTITLTIPDLAPTWGMEIRCFLQSVDGAPFERRIHNTIHRLRE